MAARQQEAGRCAAAWRSASWQRSSSRHSPHGLLQHAIARAAGAQHRSGLNLQPWANTDLCVLPGLAHAMHPSQADTACEVACIGAQLPIVQPVIPRKRAD